MENGRNTEDTFEPFGQCAPRGFDRWVLGTSGTRRTTSLSKLSRIFAKHWVRKTKRSYDVIWRDIRLRLSPHTNAGDMNIVLDGRHHDEADIDVIKRFRGMTLNFVDIGGNVGLYTLEMAKWLTAQSRILAFEPHPVTVEKFRRNLSFNGVTNVTLVCAAVADEAGRLPLFQPNSRNAGQNTLHVGKGDSGQAIMVDVVTLKEAATAAGLAKIDILKADVEGFEDRAILPYLEATPRDDWPFYFILEKAHQDVWKTDLVQVLQDAGYRVTFSDRVNIHLERRTGPRRH